MLRGRRSLPMLHFLDNASAAKGVASVNSLVLHAPIHFLRPIDFPAVGKRNMHAVSDRLWAFAFKGENVNQERFIRASDMGVTIRPHPEIYPVAPHLTLPVGRWFLREWAHARATVEQFFGKANSQLRPGRTKALLEELVG